MGIYGPAQSVTFALLQVTGKPKPVRREMKPFRRPGLIRQELGDNDWTSGQIFKGKDSLTHLRWVSTKCLMRKARTNVFDWSNFARHQPFPATIAVRH